MAFVRWRGNCAQLLATITVDGRPQQRLLSVGANTNCHHFN